MTVNTGGHTAQPVLTFHMDIGDRRLRFFDFMSYKLEHEVGGMFDVTHGAGLAAIGLYKKRTLW